MRRWAVSEWTNLNYLILCDPWCTSFYAPCFHLPMELWKLTRTTSQPLLICLMRQMLFNKRILIISVKFMSRQQSCVICFAFFPSFWWVPIRKFVLCLSFHSRSSHTNNCLKDMKKNIFVMSNAYVFYDHESLHCTLNFSYKTCVWISSIVILVQMNAI